MKSATLSKCSMSVLENFPVDSPPHMKSYNGRFPMHQHGYPYHLSSTYSTKNMEHSLLEITEKTLETDLDQKSNVALLSHKILSRNKEIKRDSKIRVEYDTRKKILK